ncbi:MAG: hypothetical protein A2504_02220 [Bdellovibrionales bacterium RIFOXYD12_FULL_39_22]|nr:MAG: hypothetical protein A2385_12245 [Bdellovibrionales bacterium RIFOXYB1_FULL_39_21]OFZ41411.1 MAG: hypothetical protein A2485_01415 [Bdellovibrionales bacterium RIFOXYC12_FULL_39_17]OFZ45366.1 MAG: hypothetical protein A2404_13430 [Bdellovibrionales bacterium RIFOXYC1_FULL_39_130]OFZ74562.1 MAG: hypothetical protein A2560_12535 [Bdellovibrionales bacterium RIFOXYD1_FULL_39_84]OFZ92571.1 MAG: hypothetical protein A2504_02220 [Bdellovibrionales bacterium RIFOXYD12_FULL_39_22]HLE09690.1 hy
MYSKKIYLLFFVLTIISTTTNLSFAVTYYNDETTRLKSTAGAGVGSILMDEATILNPAPIAFFNVTSLYYQASSASFANRDETRFTSNPPDPEQSAFIISDASSALKGSASYQKNIFDFSQRERYALSVAANFSPQSAFGVAYKVTKERNREDSADNITKQTYKQFTFGITHVVSDALSLGLLLVDPFKERPGDRFAAVGVQYLYAGFISLMLDGGADYSQNFKNSAFAAAAIQFKIFSDFFLRFGMFNNRRDSSSGNGVGVGWVQPRLVLELSMKNSTFTESTKVDSEKMDLQETAFSISMRF